MKRTHLIIVALVLVVAMSSSACGSDDDGITSGAAVAPPPARAFEGLSAALEAQGLQVTQLAKTSLNGAEAGVDITGAKSGSARSFATEAEARDYAEEVAANGDKTTIVGTVVLQAATQDDADFFADAYEGG